jgi:8-oxo-dGTP diphosphatase
LYEETGLGGVYVEQLYTFGGPKRDPRTRVITVAYYALIPAGSLSLSPSGDALEARFLPVAELPELAFDHRAIVDYAVQRLQNKISYSNLAFALLPDEFPLSALQRAYEAILGHPIDKRNFRKRLEMLDLLEETGEIDASGAHRPARLFRFKSRELRFLD